MACFVMILIIAHQGNKHKHFLRVGCSNSRSSVLGNYSYVTRTQYIVWLLSLETYKQVNTIRHIYIHILRHIDIQNMHVDIKPAYIKNQMSYCRQ